MQQAHAIHGQDDELPDKQEIVDTADGLPNPEWLLLRAHKRASSSLAHTHGAHAHVCAR